MRKFNYKRLIVMLVVVLAMTCLMATTAFAAGTGDVAGAVESTWSTASTQIKSVVDNVVFPAHRPDPCCILLRQAGHRPTSSTENPASSSGRLPPSCLPVSCLPSLRPCISGASLESKEGI